MTFLNKRFFFIFIACALLSGGCFSSKNNEVIVLNDQDFTQDNFHVVREEKLYRSGQIPAARLTAYLKKFNIKTIINLRNAAEKIVCCRGEEAAAQRANCKVLYAPMSAGSASTREEILELLAQFDNAESPILIHCSQGINRTGEACALWLMDKEQVSNDEALKQFAPEFGYVYKKRPEKYLFIKAWQGRAWLKTIYDPKNP